MEFSRELHTCQRNIQGCLPDRKRRTFCLFKELSGKEIKIVFPSKTFLSSNNLLQNFGSYLGPADCTYVTVT